MATGVAAEIEGGAAVDGDTMILVCAPGAAIGIGGVARLRVGCFLGDPAPTLRSIGSGGVAAGATFRKAPGSAAAIAAIARGFANGMTLGDGTGATERTGLAIDGISYRRCPKSGDTGRRASINVTSSMGGRSRRLGELMNDAA